MDIKRFNHLVALAEEGRFSLAAKRVHLSQAAFSRSIQALEAQLDLRLFDRGAEGARLTPAGEIVLARARALLLESSALQRDIALIRNGDVGKIAVGAAPVPAYIIVPDMLSQLREHSPRLMVRVRMGNLRDLLEQLDAHELDFCMGDPRLIPPTPRYAMLALGQHRGSLYCRHDHPLARQATVDAAAFTTYGLAMTSLSTSLQAWLAAHFGLPDYASFGQVVECDDVHTLVRVVASSNLLGMLPHAVARQAGGQVHRLDFAGAGDVHADVHAIWLHGRTLAPAAARAVQLARQVSLALIATP